MKFKLSKLIRVSWDCSQRKRSRITFFIILLFALQGQAQQLPLPLDAYGV